MQKFLNAVEVRARLEMDFCPKLIKDIGLDEKGIFLRIDQGKWNNPANGNLVEKFQKEINQHKLKTSYINKL